MTRLPGGSFGRGGDAELTVTGPSQLVRPALEPCSSGCSPIRSSRLGEAVASAAAAGWPSSRGQRWSSMRLLWNLLSRSKKHSSSEDEARGMPWGQGRAVSAGSPRHNWGCSAGAKVRLLLSDLQSPHDPGRLPPPPPTSPGWRPPSARPLPSCWTWQQPRLASLPPLGVVTPQQQPRAPCPPGTTVHKCSSCSECHLCPGTLAPDTALTGVCSMNRRVCV